MHKYVQSEIQRWISVKVKRKHVQSSDSLYWYTHLTLMYIVNECMWNKNNTYTANNNNHKCKMIDLVLHFHRKKSLRKKMGKSERKLVNQRKILLLSW